MAEPTQPPESTPVELAEGYYADNFAAVLDTVVERYEDLLEPAELGFVERYRGLGVSAQRLYVRLISRKGPCFRRDRLDYSEIPDLDRAIEALTGAGLLDDGADGEPTEWLALLLRGELDELARRLEQPIVGGTKKGELIAALVEAVPHSTLWCEVTRRFTVLRPLGHEVLRVFRLLFFGNLGQDWTEFVLRDLGVVRYESYSLDRALRAFDERRAIEHQLVLRDLRDRLFVALETEDGATAAEIVESLCTTGWHDSARSLRDRVVVRFARSLERSGDLDRALQLYAQTERPPARERRVRILERRGRLAEALDLARALEDEPRDETEAVFAPRTVHRLRRALGESLGPWRRPRRATRTLDLERVDGVAVEQRALEALAGRGQAGFFAENWLWKSLFGLAFWDIVFAPIPGAFQHPFQLGPLDLRGTDFRRRRRAAVEERLEVLRSDPDPGPALLARFDAKQGIANPFVPWFDGMRDLLAFALEPLGGEHLAAVCDRLSREPRRYRRGLPDLFVLRDEAPGFELLEVKAPGDQLRPEQGAWIDYLEAQGLPATVLKIRWL